MAPEGRRLAGGPCLNRPWPRVSPVTPERLRGQHPKPSPTQPFTACKTRPCMHCLGPHHALGGWCSVSICRRGKRDPQRSEEGCSASPSSPSHLCLSLCQYGFCFRPLLSCFQDPVYASSSAWNMPLPSFICNPAQPFRSLLLDLPATSSREPSLILSLSGLHALSRCTLHTLQPQPCTSWTAVVC